MERNIASIMNRNVVAVDIDDTVEVVEQLIHSRGLSFVPVFGRDARPFGVISASDLVHFHAGHDKPRHKRAWEICTQQVVKVPPHMATGEVASLMIEKRVHHVVVMEDGKVSGIVSSLDLIDKLCLGNKG